MRKSCFICSMTANRKLIVYIASSLDGYIAKTGDDLSFLSIVEQPGQDYGYAEFISSVDTIVIGRRTFDWVMQHAPSYAHPEKEVFVITKTPRESLGNTRFYNGDLLTLIKDLKAAPGKNIFCDGGATLVNQLAAADLVDEYVISVIPVLIGEGIRLFADGRPEQRFELVRSAAFPSGLVQSHYRRSKEH